MKRLLVLIVFSALLLVGCDDKKNGNESTYLPSSVGPINSVAVVIYNDLWDVPVGVTFRRYFAPPVVGLPM